MLPPSRYGTTSYGTLSCFCFLLSGLFSDLLLVRYSLVLAYSFLIISIILGFPDIYTWGMAPPPVTLCYGNLLWQIASLIVQVRQLGTMHACKLPVGTCMRTAVGTCQKLGALPDRPLTRM